MKRVSILFASAAVALSALTAFPCAAAPAKPAPKATAKSKEVKVGDKAVCCVCAVRDGMKKPEEVKAVLKYKGKTYPFCSVAEKAEFINNPAKYAKAAK